MQPYCGWKRAQKSDVNTSKFHGPHPSWHRPPGIARIERQATRHALKASARQAGKRELQRLLQEQSAHVAGKPRALTHSLPIHFPSDTQ